MLEPPHILALDRDHVIASWRDVLVINWRVHTSLEAVQRLRAIMGRFIADRPARAATFTIIEADASMPEAEARTSMAAALRMYAPKLHASAIVVEGEGFRAAAVRSVITGLALLSRTTHPHRAFAKVDDAVVWLAKLCGHLVAEPFATTELEKAIEIARSYRATEPRTAS